MNQLKRVLKMSPVKVIKKLCCFEEIYTIAYRARENKSLLEDDRLAFLSVPYNDDFWYADPILITYHGESYLFAECFDMRTQKGRIGCARFCENGKLSEFVPIIEEMYHLSFPMVFEWDGTLYMIPESSDNLSLNLYRCEGTIYDWQKVMEFPTEKPLVDTVVLSCCKDSVSLLSAAIHPKDPLLFQWQTLTLRKEENFTLQENGTVDGYESYSRGSRMAGKLADLNGELILPTQESIETDYGIYLHLNKVSSNTLQKLSGKRIAVDDLRIDEIDAKKMIGIHSYALSERYEVIDVRYFHFSPKNRMRKIKCKFKRIGK